jgi:translation initiation factor 6
VRTTIQGSAIVGSLVAGNSRAVVVSGLATPDEVRALEDYREVYRLEGAMNAAGNVILANDRFAAVHPEMEPDVIEEVGSHLGVEVTRLTLGGVKTVGMAGYATNRGVLVHARATPREISRLETATDLPIGTGSVNMGSGLVGTGMLANSHGYIAGVETSGFELGRIADVFGFVEGL